MSNIKEEKDNNASFFKKLIAFFIDSLLVSLLASFIAFPFVDSSKLVNSEKRLLEVENDKLSEKISQESYIAELSNAYYKLSYTSAPIFLITLFIKVVYYVVYQFKSNGQTIGKRLMKIRVVSIKETFSRDQLLFRSLIIDSLLFNIITFIFLLVFKANMFYQSTVIISYIHSVIMLICVGMILFSKSKRGLHDIISYTKVIND